MDIKLSIFAEGNPSFPPQTQSVWLTPDDYRTLFPNVRNMPCYVRVLSRKNPLQKFVFYAKADMLNEKTMTPHGMMYAPSLLMHRTWSYDSGMTVEVEPVNPHDLPVAEALTVRLNPEEVAHWSDDEVDTAEALLHARVGIVYAGQMLFVKPATKQTVVGEIVSLFPTPKERGVAMRMDDTTRIAFEGLPANRQKVIDFSKIGGLDNVINRLREIIQIPINYPELLTRFGIDPPKGMILYGPPGNGKTMIARAVAQSMGSAFIEIDRSELLSKYVGDSEKHLGRKFEEAAIKGNCVIFIDEIDSLAAARSADSAEHQVSLVSTLLVLMDGINANSRVFVVGATNRLEAVDPALRRPGRFDLEYEVPLPDQPARLDILSKYVPLAKPELLAPDLSMRTLALLSELTGGYSGADMKMLYREAAMQAIRRHLQFDKTTGKVQLTSAADDIRLEEADFHTAMKGITPTQMRGEQKVDSTALWDDLVGLDEAKQRLSLLDMHFSHCVGSVDLQARPSMANLLLCGPRGSGKRTLAAAFARRFGYELMLTDCIDLDSIPLDEAMQELHRMAAKCRQSAPALWYIQHLDSSLHRNDYAHKIVGELQRLNKHIKVLAIVATEHAETLPEALLGYKAFEQRLDLTLTPEQICTALHQLMPTLPLTLAEVEGRTLGQMIATMREQSIINTIHSTTCDKTSI